MMSVVKLQDKMKKIAVDDDGGAARPASPSSIAPSRSLAIPIKSIPLQQVVDAAYGYKTPIPGVEPGLDATSFYEPRRAPSRSAPTSRSSKSIRKPVRRNF